MDSYFDVFLVLKGKNYLFLAVVLTSLKQKPLNPKQGPFSPHRKSLGTLFKSHKGKPCMLISVLNILTGLCGLVVKCAHFETSDLSPLWFEPRLGHM